MLHLSLQSSSLQNSSWQDLLLPSMKLQRISSQARLCEGKQEENTWISVTSTGMTVEQRRLKAASPNGRRAPWRVVDK